MNTAVHPHVALLNQLEKEYGDILASSPQGVYIYLDDPHWTANRKLAAMLGFASVSELVGFANESSFLDALVAPESAARVQQAYFGAVNDKAGSVAEITWKKKGGGTLKSRVIFVPISFQGNRMSLHFVSAI
jgi:hypothetical protein